MACRIMDAVSIKWKDKISGEHVCGELESTYFSHLICSLPAEMAFVCIRILAKEVETRIFIE